FMRNMFSPSGVDQPFSKRWKAQNCFRSVRKESCHGVRHATPRRSGSKSETRVLSTMGEHRFHLDVTEKCNIRCVHCYWEEYGKHPDPSLDTIDEILKKFKELGRAYGERSRHILTIGGGEPTVRKDLKEIVRLAVRRGFRVRLVTNAVLVDDSLARSLRKSGL